MSFGTELQSKSSHEALLGLQDFEIKFLEHIKKCIFQRIKIDRDHSTALSSLASQITKFDNSEYETPMSKAWQNFGREIENYSKLIHDITDRVCANSLDKLQQLISEKRMLRKVYQEERARLENDCKQMNDEVNRLANDYTKLLEKLQANKVKYESNLGKGRSLKHDEMRVKLLRNEARVNLVHNEYTLMLKEANLQEKQHTTILLPALLQSQQNLQAALVRQCQEVLLDYIHMVNTASEEFQQLQNNNVANMTLLNSDKEYNGFIVKFRSDPQKIKFYEFLVATHFPANDIVVNNVTLPILNQKKIEYTNDLLKCQHWLACKKSELNEIKLALQGSCDRETVNLLSHMVQIRSSETLQREVMEHQCVEDRCTKMLEFIDESFNCCYEDGQSLPSCFADYPELAGVTVSDLIQLDSTMATMFSTNNSTSDNLKTTLNPIRATFMKLNPVRKQFSINIPTRPVANFNNNNNNSNNNSATNVAIDGNNFDNKFFNKDNDNDNKNTKLLNNNKSINNNNNNNIGDDDDRNIESREGSGTPITLPKSATGRRSNMLLSSSSGNLTHGATQLRNNNINNNNNVDNRFGNIINAMPERPPRKAANNNLTKVISRSQSPTVTSSSPSSPSFTPHQPPPSSSSSSYTFSPLSRSTPPPLPPQQQPPPLSSPSSSSPPPPPSSSSSSSSSMLAKLESEEWYHGVLPREEVQRLLLDDGDFLLRCSKNRKTNETQFVLSVMWSGVHKHFIVQGDEVEGYRFEGVSHPSVQALIHDHLTSGEIITKRSEVILHRPIPKATWELNNDQIELKEKIGSGQFGEVFRGLLIPANQEVAVKTCRETLTEDLKRKFLQEGRILKQYDHPNIVKFIGIAAQRHPVMIVMEFVPGGSLLTFLRYRGAGQSVSTLVQMCTDVAAGMHYLENNNCLHRDLAARNCLIGDNNIIKISDFGMSREEQEYIISGGLKQIPIKWTAPEALNFGLYTWSCDVWSYGILMWEVFSNGGNPYPGLTNSQARDEVDAGYRMPCPEKCPSNVYALMLSCWNKEPKLRPHFSHIHQQLLDLRSSLADS